MCSGLRLPEGVGSYVVCSVNSKKVKRNPTTVSQFISISILVLFCFTIPALATKTIFKKFLSSFTTPESTGPSSRLNVRGNDWGSQLEDEEMRRDVYRDMQR